MKKKILVKGPMLSQSGYGVQTRFALRALRSREDLFDIYINPITWGQTSWIYEKTEEREWIDAAVNKAAKYIENKQPYDMSVQVTIPNEWERIAPYNVGYTAGIETTRVAPEWIEKANMMDKIIVVSNHSKNVFEDTTYVLQN